MGWKLAKPSAALARASVAAGDLEPRLGPPRLAPLGEARGRLAILAAATGPWPRYPRVELDGCSVRAGSVSKGSRLRVAGRLRPYSGPTRLSRPGEECVWTDTGAPLPLGADAVAPREILEAEDGHVRLLEGVKAWRSISLPASDVATGDPVLVPRRLATPEAVAAAASLGFRGLPVDAGEVRVCVASVGDELVEPWEDGAVRDSNRYQLAARLRRAGLSVVDLGIVRDDVADAVWLIREAARRECRALVTSGGTSVGLSDPLPAAVSEEGVILIHGLRMRPGRPTLIGMARGVLVVGLPGNPRSAGNVAENVLLPLLTLLSFSQAGKGYVEATVAYTLENPGERPASIPVALIKGRDELLALPVARESFMVFSWALASATLELGPGERIEAGATVEVYAYADAYRAAVDAADSGLTTINGLPLLKPPLGRESLEAAETASSLGIPVLAASREGGSRAIATRRIVVAGDPDDGGYSAQCAAPGDYEVLCQLSEPLRAPRIEAALLMYIQGYSASYAGPLYPWTNLWGAREKGSEHLVLKT